MVYENSIWDHGGQKTMEAFVSAQYCDYKGCNYRIHNFQN
jgi:hypothetical protein